MPQSQALRGVELTAVRTAWGFQAFIAGISFLVLLFQSADVVYNTWKYDFNSRPEVIFWMVRRLVATISASLIVYTALVQYASFEHIEFKTCRKLAVRLELVKSASVLCGCLALFVGTLFVNGECGSWNGGEIRRAAAVAIIPFSFVFAVSLFCPTLLWSIKRFRENLLNDRLGGEGRSADEDRPLMQDHED